jgi:hypothetical protein
MGQVKGSAVTARVRYVRELFGEDGYRRLVAALLPAHRALLGARVQPHAWVPYEFFIDVNVTADRLFAAGDLMLCYEMGRYGAEINLPTLYRIFYQLANPLFIFGKAARIWDVHYDSGRLVTLKDGPQAVRLRIEDFESPHRAHCLSVLGWASRSVELSGGTLSDVRESACRTLGDPFCELGLAWQ